ncbi:MAG: hypothetical protein ACUVRQ_09305 [Thermoanaerobaculaceae bacterium]
MAENQALPTMIIPQGTEISVNEAGQLSIRTPGNLIIQNPGNYSHIVSTAGSLRIDPNVNVDAVTVQVADTCYIGGSLTAWQVKAKRVVLEKGAKAFIVIRESETLELDKGARLVGNFDSEKELYLLLGRFSQQLKSLPQGLTPIFKELVGESALGNQALPAEAKLEIPAQETSPGDRRGEEPVSPESGPISGSGPSSAEPAVQTWANLLVYLDTVLVREAARADLSPGARAALHRALSAVRSGRPEGVKEAFGEVEMALFEYSPLVEEACRRLAGWFGETGKEVFG